MKNYLFVVPRFAPFGKYYVFPNGLAYVVSYMKHKGFNVACLNLCHYNDTVENLLRDSIDKYNIDVICTGAMSFYWNEVKEVLDTAKKIKPGIITVAGGAIVSSEPKLALENMPIDFGVAGEGEETMADLASALCSGSDVSKVKSIVYFDKNNNFITTARRAAIADLDALPFPDYEGLEFDNWLNIKWIMQPSLGGVLFDISEEQRLCEISTSRSCPYQCTFCYHPLGKTYRQRSLDNVFKEIDHLTKKYNISILNLLDELFSLDKERINEFSARIKKYNIKWMAQWRANNIDEQVLKTLKESNILTIGLGVESLSDKVLKSMMKGITKADIERAYKLSLDMGVRASSNIILGDPAETEETVKESLDWWRKHPEYDISLGVLLAVPDSKVWKDAVANNLIKDKVKFIKDKFPCINLTKISDKRFNKIKKKVDYYVLTQKYILRGKVISSKREPDVHNGKAIYTFRVECPLCKSISEYRNAKYSSTPYSIVLCKKCLKKLKIKTKSAFYYDYNAIYGFLFHYAFIVYNIYLRRHPFFKNTAKLVRKILPESSLRAYSGWLNNG